MSIYTQELEGNLFCGGEWPRNLDQRASFDRYCDLLAERLSDEFAGEEITVERLYGCEGQGRPVQCDGTEGHWQADTVDNIRETLFADCDAWMVMETVDALFARFYSIGNAEMTGRVLPAPLEEAEEWVESGTLDGNPVRVYYVFDGSETAVEADEYPWDAAHVAYIMDGDDRVIVSREWAGCRA